MRAETLTRLAAAKGYRIGRERPGAYYYGKAGDLWSFTGNWREFVALVKALPTDAPPELTARALRAAVKHLPRTWVHVSPTGTAHVARLSAVSRDPISGEPVAELRRTLEAAGYQCHTGPMHTMEVTL